MARSPEEHEPALSVAPPPRRRFMSNARQRPRFQDAGLAIATLTMASSGGAVAARGQRA